MCQHLLVHLDDRHTFSTPYRVFNWDLRTHRVQAVDCLTPIRTKLITSTRVDDLTFELIKAVLLWQ